MATVERWRVRPGTTLDLSAIDTRDAAAAPGDKEATLEATALLTTRLGELQERLWAEGRRSVLVVLQAMDAGGKDGTVKHIFRAVNPAGARVTSFKAPSAEERAHDFLWRVHAAVPARGEIGIFNRSHYEDVVVVRVDELVPEPVWRARYDAIWAWEHHLAAEGTVIVKLFLHISPEEQAQRFRDRLDDPTKHWKFNRGDLAVRARWDDHQAAYAEAIERTTTDEAPWYVVPADRKWFRNWVVSSILVDTLEAMDPQFPEPADDLSGIEVV
ncbi:polyphosphate kinase 2 family protein [Iamia sp. SCSIO 61187]|uniref:PPK2 family polyphosphate kinase n=1 Tax=Iamia sp. SCSIO 61187 TaxID=2722752 RepID=UPI001C6327CA|nr:PPK2 family polyphosphate kinase [Iamia sp. SCSIO 61187]QYG93666.1 polyphosphate kinase 2 family protein [Iamia sp. SCSIO 61187]